MTESQMCFAGVVLVCLTIFSVVAYAAWARSTVQPIDMAERRRFEADIAALKSRAEAAEGLVADYAARLHRALQMIEVLPHYTRVEWSSEGTCFMGERCNSCGFTGEHRPDCKLLEFIDTEKVKVVN